MAIANLSLSMPHGSLLNCLGIQPVFHTNYHITTSFLGFVYRMATQVNKKGQMKYLMKYRLGEENKEVIDNKFHISEAPQNLGRGANEIFPCLKSQENESSKNLRYSILKCIVI